MKKLLTAALTISLILSGFVLPLHIFERLGITASAAENMEISFDSETAVPDSGAVAWPEPEAFNVLSVDEKDWTLPYGFAVAAKPEQNVNELLTTASNSCGAGLTWTLAGETLIISGTGEMNDYTDSYAPWDQSKYLIKSILVENGVTRIGAQAFADCANINSVALPNTLTSIGEGAF